MTAEKSVNLSALMYHGIVSAGVATPDDREVGAELYDMPVAHFKAQMEYLKNRNYKVVVNGTGAEMGNHVIITFDDGEMNNFDLAFPVLRGLGFKAYFFIIAARVGRKGYMGMAEMKALHGAGMIIGSHGLSHEILTNLKETQIEEELTASKKYLERNLEIPIEALSVPRGFCNDKIIQMAYTAGYKTVFISERPKRLKVECIDRIPVKGHWSLQRFEQALTGNVPWGEKIGEQAKQSAKFILREGGYNWVRSVILKLVK
ncbi:MAG TPA: hypothetical protein DD723_09030 [Candidatus Omnitrophica bacterium]|nr:MAG: hypothetical protein A2Z81_08630 [Omnitrophica WOR_2 bacterium GWA2_45_18]OGX19218.1 MAG: hypothetical protein A2Y04_00165 [Omnitrophica WOR_2 bacterium GWC2_45_7]HBR15660.1 hypothetical protein [Candidatus Omnitrophota bacterium]